VLRNAAEWADARPRVTARIALLICLVVVVARVVIAVVTPPAQLVGDSIGYDLTARRLAQTGRFAYTPSTDVRVEPVANAQQMPGYPAFLAALYRMAGPSVPALPLVAIVQALLSGVTLWGLFVLARRLSSPAGGLTATALGALYPPFWWSYELVLTEDLFVALCVWIAVSLVVAMQADALRALLASAAMGVLATAAVYVRATAAIWLLLAAAALLAFDRERRRHYLTCGLIAVLIVVAGFSPWWIRNARIYGRFIPLSTLTASPSLAAISGDYEAETWSAVKPYEVDYLHPKQELALNAVMKRLTREITADRWADDPFGLVWQKTRALLISIFTYHPNPFGGFTGWGGLTEAIHLMLLALAAVGAGAHRKSPAVWVLIALPIALMGVHAATLAFSRYLFPMMPVVIIFAALGVLSLARVPLRD